MQKIKQTSCTIHCVKTAQIRSYFWFEYRKIETRNNYIFGQFLRNDRSYNKTAELTAIRRKGKELHEEKKLQIFFK